MQYQTLNIHERYGISCQYYISALKGKVAVNKLDFAGRLLQILIGDASFLVAACSTVNVECKCKKK